MPVNSMVWVAVGVLGALIDGVRAQIPTSTSAPAITFPSSTTAVPVSSASPSPVLLFHPIQPVTACRSAAITWAYDGPSAPLSLIVTNQDVGGSSASTATSSSVLHGGRRHVNYQEIVVRSSIAETLTTSANPFELSFTWSQVNVPQGTYAILANLDGFRTQSASFLVINGTDVSCLGSTSSTSAVSSPTSASSSTPISNLGGSGTNHRNSHLAAIVGAVAGGAVLLLAIAACLLLAKSRRSERSSPRRRSNWAGLGSRDSTVIDDKDVPPASPARSKKFSHTTSESVGAILGDTSVLGHSPASSEDAHSPSVEDVPDRDERAGRRASSSSRRSYNRTRASLDGYRHRPDSFQMGQPSSVSSRRGARKAVPRYATETEQPEPGPSPENSLPSSDGHPLSGAEPDLGLAHHAANGFGLKGEVLGSDPARPVHYLIPDTPSAGGART